MAGFKSIICIAFVILISSLGDRLSAAQNDDSCDDIAAVTVAEMKAASPAPVAPQTLDAARAAAKAGCLAGRTARSDKTEELTASPVTAQASPAQKTKAVGFFDFLTRDVERAAGHERLRRRGRN